MYPAPYDDGAVMLLDDYPDDGGLGPVVGHREPLGAGGRYRCRSGYRGGHCRGGSGAGSRWLVMVTVSTTGRGYRGDQS